MTIDKSLKIKKGVTRSRNVLTRVERIEKMQATDRWTEETSPFNLPKIRVYKVVLKKKKKVVLSVFVFWEGFFQKELILQKISLLGQPLWVQDLRRLVQNENF